MRRALAALGLLGALSAAGCGGPEAEARAAIRGATRTLEDYMAAMKKGDCKAAYACLSWRRRQETPLAEIQADYDGHRERYRSRAGARIKDLHYDGFRVYSNLQNEDGNECISLVPEEGGWRIEDSGRSYQHLMEKARRLGGPAHPEDRPGGG